MTKDHTYWKGAYTMRSNRYLLTVHWDYIPKKTYLFVHLLSALEAAEMVKKSHPDLRINLIRKGLTPEQCEAVLSMGNLDT